MENQTEMNAGNSATAPSTIMDVTLKPFDGEPRARDLDIAERLGFERPRKIRELIERNLIEIEGFGVCPTVGRTSGPKGGRPTAEYWLNEEQALLVAALSDAPNAVAVRRMLIKVFVAWRRGQIGAAAALPQPTSAEVGAVFGGIAKRQREQIVGAVFHNIERVLEAERHIWKRLSRIERMMANAEASPVAVHRGVTAGEVVKMAGVMDRKGLRGLPQWTSNKLARFSAKKGVAVNLAELGLHSARVFDTATAREWLAEGGKAEIERRIAERRGQGVLQLVPNK